VATTATSASPAPQAMPIAVVIQTIAAVVRPRTASPRTKISPPPMKPIPATIWAATRDGSRTTLEPGTSPKPYLPTITNNAAPTPTKVCVRRPVGLWRHSRSSPISDVSPSANPSSPICFHPWLAARTAVTAAPLTFHDARSASSAGAQPTVASGRP
jgi:hypothetical protein